MLSSTISTREEFGEISFILVRDSNPKVQTTLPLFVCEEYNGTPRDPASNQAVGVHLEALSNSDLLASFSRIPESGSVILPPSQSTEEKGNKTETTGDAQDQKQEIDDQNFVPIDLNASINLGSSEPLSFSSLDASGNLAEEIIEACVEANKKEQKNEEESKSEEFIPNTVIKQVFWGEKVTKDTSIGLLEGLDEAMVELLQAQAGLSTIGDFASLPTANPDTYTFLVDAELIPGIKNLVRNCKCLLDYYGDSQTTQPAQTSTKSNSPPPAEPPKEKEENLVNPFGYVDLFRQLEGVKENNLATWLHKNAYVYTLAELSRFPNAFPGIYSQLKAFGGLGAPLDEYIGCCKRLVGGFRRGVRDGESFDWFRLEYDEDSLEDVKLETIYRQHWLQKVDPIVLANC